MSSFLRRARSAVRLHWLTFSAEVGLFWMILEAFQFLGYGGQPGGTQGSDEVLPLTLVMAALALGAGEARFHLNRRVWSVAGLNDAVAVGLAATEATILITIANAAMPDGTRPYRLAVPVLATPAVILAMGLYRLLPRVLHRVPASASKLLVVVQNAAGYATVKALAQHGMAGWQPVGIVTRQVGEEHKTVLGIPVLGHVGRLKNWIKSSDADGVAFVLEGTPVSDQRDLIGICLAAEKPIFILPGSQQWYSGHQRSPMRPLSADDLVGRAPRDVELAKAGELIRGHTVLVTGAAGSVGAELCRILAGAGARRLVLVDDNESGLFDIAGELQVNPTSELREALVSVVDRDALLRVFADERPDIVFHAAAYKHVPMLEAHPIQAFETNVIGTRNVIRCAEASGVRSLVLISTDKAVARHSVMGCTKRLCEQMVLTHNGDMKCWAVRFGNVVGSRGSVVPLFEKQIEQGGPVTITHPQMSRYFMTIQEAVSLIVYTLTIGSPGHLYMLDMGKPINIANLAQDLVRSRGLQPGKDIEFIFTGLRPGERLSEELLAADEGVRPTENPAILELISPSPLGEDDLEWTIERLTQMASEGRGADLAKALKNAVRAPARAPRADESVEQPTQPEPSADQP